MGTTTSRVTIKLRCCILSLHRQAHNISTWIAQATSTFVCCPLHIISLVVALLHLTQDLTLFPYSTSQTMADPAVPIDTPSRRSTSSPSISHRSSLAENLRQSPRAQRHPSLGQASVQELINHPPTPKTGDPRFIARDWRNILVGELVQQRDVRWAELDTPIEAATKLLLESGPPNVILVRESSNVK